MNNTNCTPCYIKLWGNFHIFCIGMCLGLVVFNLNVLIIVTIIRSKALHTNTNIFIASVALLDCFMAMTDFTQGLVYSTELRLNRNNMNVVDAVLLGTGTSAVTLSYTHMAILAVDRYINIAHPFYYISNVTKRRVIVVLFIVWLSGLVYCIIPGIYYRDNKYHRHCITSNPPSEYFIINASFNLVDYVIIFICYFRISYLAFRHKKAANVRRKHTENPENVFKIRNNRTAAAKSVKFFICLFGAFFVLTFPPAVVAGVI
ncbi:unnamed protein product [Candidula unifasciata]|uniref:G-protein coupled receptors family 1 profile domain-containing protein n=1 Tax=Candidula unifasciata TaxID=100452 RepID=A0A8S4A1L1_9EUPU|nr:unnamed protein product [Candidula unifasciata]